MVGRVSIYLAAPLFNRREREHNTELASRLESVGAEVFLPQRDGALLANMLAAGVPQTVAERRVYLQDTEAMKKASLLIAVLDGAVVDDGVAFEIGFMTAQGKVCVGLQTDVRRALPSGNNPMIGQSMTVIVGNEDELVAWVAQAVRAASEIEAAC